MTNAARALLSACALLWGQVTPIASAQEMAAASVSLEVRAVADCASFEDLSGRVAARLPRIRFGEDSKALLVRARFAPQPSGNVLVELTLARAGAKPTLRRVVASSCRQAADAAALIIAVTVDPTVLSEAKGATEIEPAKKAGDPTSRGESSNPTFEPPRSPDATTSEKKRNAAGRGDTMELSPPVATAAPEPSNIRPATTRFATHVSGVTLFGVSPAVMPGVGFDGMAALDRDAVWSPAIVLGALHAWKNGLVEQGGTAAFALDAASLDLCGIRLRLLPIEGRLCAAGLLGRLSAQGSNTRNAPGTIGRLFAAVGGSATVTGTVHSMLELSARAALGANLVQDSFEFAPFVFHTVSPVTVSVSVGLGLRSR